MDDRRFDDLTRLLGRATTRRQVFRAIAGAAVAGAFTRLERPRRARAAAPRIAPANDPFRRTWERTDRPVAEGRAVRTWMWGPEPFTEALQEPYAESPGGTRTVQYYDKSRMEITHPDAVDDGVWYVTNGLLVSELMSGKMQTGDASFEPRSAAQVNVAGDPDDADGPTYASFAAVTQFSTGAQDAVITRALRRDGSTFTDARFTAYGVRETHFTDETRYWIAGPFWDFMNSSGVVYENGQFVTGQLFLSPYYATGFPVTDAYWARVRVGGTQKDVLVQCFERRCLTYTPDNAPEWRVEMGNVGRHYRDWREQGGNGQVVLGYAPDSVKGDLISQALGNAQYQALASYITGLGFFETGMEAYQTAEDGGATTYSLVTSYQENQTPAGLARLNYWGPDQVWAVVENADHTASFVVYVGDDGQLQAAHPELDADATTGAAGTGLAGRDSNPACDKCYRDCGRFINNITLDIEDLCVEVAFSICAPLNKPTRQALLVCTATAWAGCVASGGGNFCAFVCADPCSGTCDSCSSSYDRCCDGDCKSGNLTGYSSNHCKGCNQGCGPGQICCGSQCVDNWRSNAAACGPYCQPCGAGKVCQNGSCQTPCSPECSGGQRCCDGQCKDLQSDSDNCGYCGIKCRGGEFCVNGLCTTNACDPPCTAPAVCCDTVCVDVKTSPQHCGFCNRACQGQSGACCDGHCVDLQSDEEYCGDCGIACNPGEECCGGYCANLRTDAHNCRICGHACGQGESCCDGSCYNLHNDIFNCGGCGLKCPADYTCCDGVCKDLNSDRDNCGACGKACTGDLLCEDGQCVCADDIDCSGSDVCRNHHCVTCASVGGVACGNECCLNGQVCTNNTCQDPGCSATALALGECCERDSDCNGSEICVNNECAACPGQSCSDICCYGDYPTCCPSIDLCCPSGYPVCPPAGRNGCCPAGQYLCADHDWCCADGCTCTANGCDCGQPCQEHDDCNGTDVCIDGECVSCVSAGGQPCMSDFCCGGDFPVCCGGVAQCCPGAYPVCPYPGSNWCCASGTFPCSDGVTCCDTGCTCHDGGCDCSGSIVAGSGARASGRAQEFTLAEPFDAFQQPESAASARG